MVFSFTPMLALLLALIGHASALSNLNMNGSTLFDRGHYYHSSPHAHLMARQNDGTTACGPSNPCKIGCCGNGGNANNA